MVNRFSVNGNNMKYIKKSEKLSKFQKLSKNRNSFIFGIKKAELSFLIFDVKKTFNYLWLIFTKAPIF